MCGASAAPGLFNSRHVLQASSERKHGLGGSEKPNLGNSIPADAAAGLFAKRGRFGVNLAVSDPM
jgi:hypothetical protein